MTGDSLFRKRSLDRVSSPDQLDQYLHVASPRAWMALALIVLLLVAAGACLALGTVPTTEPVTVTVEDGRVRGEVDLPDGAYEAQVTTGEVRLVDLVLGR